VGRDAQIAHARIVGEHELDRGWEAARPAPVVEDMGDGGGAEGVNGRPSRATQGRPWGASTVR
jgi:hypothetical protein